MGVTATFWEKPLAQRALGAKHLLESNSGHLALKAQAYRNYPLVSRPETQLLYVIEELQSVGRHRHLETSEMQILRPHPCPTMSGSAF